MKISTHWLNEWVNVTTTEQELADQLTLAGLEVDAISPVAADFTGVVVAEVLNTKPHPDANKLTLCEINANTGAILNVVCGASNVRPGLKVALATIGAHLPGGLTIKETKLRGELSQGMLCSVSELGIEDESEGIMELEADAPIGMDLRAYLNLDDYILDIDLTPNRADCFSVQGVAREVSALLNQPLTTPVIEPVLPQSDETLAISLNAPEACPNYCGRVIKGINPNAQTPLWMAERLRRGGIRIVHPVVDVMNYVMLELGQPMHAFDLATIQGGVQVRWATAGEALELLDGQDVAINDKVLVIADDHKALAMAGVMGGAESAVNESTQDVFLESAFFSPVVIAGVARSFGLFSDSSQRYERGVDPYLQKRALERATALITSICGGIPGPVIEATNTAHLPKPATLVFDAGRVKQLTGVSIPLEDIKAILSRAGFAITAAASEQLTLKVPTYRFDIQIQEDLVEEVIRIYGYEKLQAEPIRTVAQAGTVCLNEAIARQMTHWFKARGYHETISYSFVDPELQQAMYPEQQSMSLLNPISSELSQMRVGMWPGLIASMMHNLHRQQHTMRLFEMGVVFDMTDGTLHERSCIAGLIMGSHGALSWNEPARTYDFYDLKGDLQSLFQALKLQDVTWSAEPHDALHPGQTAIIRIAGVDAGWIGVLHPRLADALEVSQDVMLFELDVKALQNAVPVRYKTISKFPQIRRDLSFLVDNAISASQIEATIRRVASSGWLKAFDVFDVYTGTGIPEGKKSLAIALTLQDESRTLVDTEINAEISAIISALETELSMTLRD